MINIFNKTRESFIYYYVSVVYRSRKIRSTIKSICTEVVIYNYQDEKIYTPCPERARLVLNISLKHFKHLESANLANIDACFLRETKLLDS